MEIVAIGIVFVTAVFSVVQWLVISRYIGWQAAITFWRAWLVIRICIIVLGLIESLVLLFDGLARHFDEMAFVYGFIFLIFAIASLLIVGTMSTVIILHFSVAKALDKGEHLDDNNDRLRLALHQSRRLHRILTYFDSPVARSWFDRAFHRNP
jgi:hypothetical protein